MREIFSVKAKNLINERLGFIISSILIFIMSLVSFTMPKNKSKSKYLPKNKYIFSVVWSLNCILVISSIITSNVFNEQNQNIVANIFLILALLFLFSFNFADKLYSKNAYNFRSFVTFLCIVFGIFYVTITNYIAVLLFLPFLFWMIFVLVLCVTAIPDQIF